MTPAAAASLQLMNSDQDTEEPYGSGLAARGAKVDSKPRILFADQKPIIERESKQKRIW